MRFLLDIPISTRTVAFLRQLGHDTTHLGEQHLERMSDEDAVKKARTEGRVIITMDLGFGQILAHIQTRYPSIILFRTEDASPNHIHELLKEHLPAIQTDLDAGAIVTFSDRGIRAHRLPIQLD